MKDIMKDIFEKEFILKVLLPLAGVMVFAAITFLFAPFLLLLGMLVFAVLFLFQNYYGSMMEEAVAYEEGDTNPMGEITNQVNQIIEQPVYEEPVKEKESVIKKIKNPLKKEPVVEEPVIEEVPAAPVPKKVVKKKVVRRVVKKKEVPVKEEINYDDDFEFEYGSFDE